MLRRRRQTFRLLETRRAVGYLVGLAGIAVWLYVLHALKRADLRFWRFLVGAVGLFVILMFYVRPWATQPLAQAVAAIAGLPGCGTFEAYFKYGVLFVDSASGAMTLKIDFECSGIVEIMAFVSLLAFFGVYTKPERVMVGIAGSLFIVLANVLRMVLIAEIIHFGGPDTYYLAHSLFGRLVFYALTVALYFYVFTKPQVVRMHVGRFTYDDAA